MLFATTTNSGFNSPLYGFLGLDISTSNSEKWVHGGLAVFTLSFSLPLKEALFFLLLHSLYLYVNTSLPHRNNI
jgi:hypothetical protein